MKLNIPIILYLLFLVLVCMNKPKVIEGAIFFNSPSNCPVVDRALNRADRKYRELCSGTVSTPSPTECAIASPILNFIRNEYNYVCNQEPNGDDNNVKPSE